MACLFFKLFVEGRAEEGITEKIKLALEKPHLQFKALLGESLNGVSEEFFIPKSVYISVEDGLFPWFAAALADLGSSRVVALPGQNLSAVAVDKSVLAKFIHSVSSECDIRTLLYSLYIHKLYIRR